ncbi:hypothetical protein B0T25DRAFT_462037, partial [Lasiosphaeria hispida]
IDVREERLVDITAPERYVALSYVWGQAPSFRLLRGNLARLCESGGLGAIQSELSQTTMRLVALMGERYLWIDALCLVQDDGQDMTHGIENMDTILALTLWIHLFNLTSTSVTSVESGD